MRNIISHIKNKSLFYFVEFILFICVFISFNISYGYYSNIINENSGKNKLFSNKLDYLSSFGANSVNDYSMWQEASYGSDIDVDLGICIGVAESSLGKNYARNGNNNIGNVGNNDRGDRVAYNNVFEGMKSIFKTLNGRNLGKYSRLSQLSRYGNKTGKIYASSPYNWHKNVKNCLSNIKGYDVGDDFNYRLNGKDYFGDDFEFREFMGDYENKNYWFEGTSDESTNFLNNTFMNDTTPSIVSSENSDLYELLGK